MRFLEVNNWNCIIVFNILLTLYLKLRQHTLILVIVQEIIPGEVHIRRHLAILLAYDSLLDNAFHPWAIDLIFIDCEIRDSFASRLQQVSDALLVNLHVASSHEPLIV